MPLSVATIIALPFSKNLGQILALMINAYALVAFGATLNRASTRNSWAYHGAVLLASNIASYWVFRNVYGLVSAAGVVYIVVIAYLTATTWGNFTGSKVSIFFEKMLGVKSGRENNGESVSESEKRVKYALLIILGILAVILFITTRSDHFTAFYVFSLSFLNSGIHTFVRRSRHVGNTLFHNFGLLAQGLNFFFLFRFLSQESMSWIFFLPFAMGGIFGGLFLQRFSKWLEEKIKADPDSHLISKEIKSPSRFPFNFSFFPKKTIAVLVIITAVLILLSESPQLVSVIICFAAFQYIGFTLLSRARNRNNRTYEAYTSIMSNGGWLASFGKLTQHEWGMPLFLPYIIGTMLGGNIGIGIAMHIERRFGISSN